MRTVLCAIAASIAQYRHLLLLIEHQNLILASLYTIVGLADNTFRRCKSYSTLWKRLKRTVGAGVSALRLFTESTHTDLRRSTPASIRLYKHSGTLRVNRVK
jgi:hypothetical protein